MRGEEGKGEGKELMYVVVLRRRGCWSDFSLAITYLQPLYLSLLKGYGGHSAILLQLKHFMCVSSVIIFIIIVCHGFIYEEKQCPCISNLVLLLRNNST